MVVNESAMANISARISLAERRANSKIIIPPAARSLITFTLNISHRVSLHVILRNSRTAVTALREYCSKYWLIPRAHRCEYLVVNDGADMRNVNVHMREPDTRRYRNHRFTRRFIESRKHFASLIRSVRSRRTRTLSTEEIAGK